MHEGKHNSLAIIMVIMIIMYCMNTGVAFADSNVTLSDLQVNGTTVQGFVYSKTDYDVVLPSGTVTIPNVAATAYDSSAVVDVYQAQSVNSPATVKVTSSVDESVYNTYTVNFSVAASSVTKIENASGCSYYNSNTQGITVFSSVTAGDVVGSEDVTASIQSTDGSTQKYSVYNSGGTVLSDDDYLAIGDYVKVTAADGTTTANYPITVAPSSLDTTNLIANIYSSDVSTGSVTPKTDSYQKYTYQFTATQTSTPVSILFRHDPGYFYLDDVSVQLSSGGPELITNGGFEDVYTATRLDEGESESVSLPLSWSLVGTQGLDDAGVIQSEGANTGSNCWYDGAVGGFDGIQQTIPTTIGSTYTLSFVLETTDLDNVQAATTDPYKGSVTEVLVYGGALPDGFVITPSSNDATLSSLKVGSSMVVGFDALKTDYQVVLASDDIPAVTAKANGGDNATVKITQATGLPGTATVVVTAKDGTTTKTYTVDFSLQPTGNNTIVSTAPTQIIIPASVTGATMSVTALSGVATLPTVSVQATTANGDIHVDIPDGTTVTGPSGWNGTINLPKVVAASSVTSAPSSATVDDAIEIGLGDNALVFDKAVRIDLVGKSGKLAAWVRGNVWNPITTKLSGDSQAIGDALPAGGDGYYDNGTDLIIWTKHFTTYAAYTTVTTKTSGGGGGGSSSSYPPAVTTADASSITATSAILNGNISSNNGYAVTAYGFLWGTSASSLSNKVPVGTNDLKGTFTTTLSDLTAGTVYYFESYATNQYGTVDGAVKSFTTTGAATVPPVVTPVPTPAKTATFSDVSASYWGNVAISSLSGKGIIAGYPNGTFKPDNTITRAEFATMLVKALGLGTSGKASTFADVNASDWYCSSISTAASAGVVTGIGHNKFAPNALVTREQMAEMVYKALGSKAPTVDGTELKAYSDKSATSSWAVSGMKEAVKAGIVSGISADRLAPMANATRAQAAEMIYKLLAVLGK